MNGNYGNNASLLSPTQAVGPGGRQIMEGYRKDIMNGFAQDQPRYNPVGSPTRASLRLMLIRNVVECRPDTELAPRRPQGSHPGALAHRDRPN